MKLHLRHNLNFFLISKFWYAIAWLQRIMYCLVGDLEDRFICSRLRKLSFCTVTAFSSVYLAIRLIPFSMLRFVRTPKCQWTIWFWDSTGEVVAESMHLILYFLWWFERCFSFHMSASPYFMMAEMQSLVRCFLVFLCFRKSFRRECERSCSYFVSCSVQIRMNQRTIVEPKTV